MSLLLLFNQAAGGPPAVFTPHFFFASWGDQGDDVTAWGEAGRTILWGD